MTLLGDTTNKNMINNVKPTFVKLGPLRIRLYKIKQIKQNDLKTNHQR